MLASDLAFKHFGQRFRSYQYPNKNKTAKPKPQAVRRADGGYDYHRIPREWTLTSLSWFHNGNIVVNGGQFYLHPDTELVPLDEAE